VAAEAEKMSAIDRAEAVRTIANAEAEKVRIKAQGEAESEKLLAEAAEKKYAVEAEGKRAINESSNILSKDQIAMQLRMSLMEHLPSIIKESVKPMESIEGIKIFQLGGFNGGSGGNGDSVPASDGSLADQLVNSALRYRGQAPLVDMLMSEIGLKSDDINGLTQALKEQGGTIESKSKTAPPESEDS
jgi:uncharacterized membrane protein YqiK